jgi:small-conductance mechanosensitive channel
VDDADWMEAVAGALRRDFLGNPAGTWMAALGVAIAVVATLFVLRRGLRGAIGRLLSRLPGQLDDIVVRTAAGTHGLFIAIVGVWAGAQFLALPEAVSVAIDRITGVAVLLQGGSWLHRIANKGLRAWAGGVPHPPSPTAIAALTFVAGIAVWSVVLLLVLQNLGVRIGALLAGLGVGGIAAALALQTVLKDLFASLSIYTDRPFDIGDFIIVGDLMGTVNRVGLRTTRITSLGGEQIVFPNGDLVESRIRNFKRMQRRRVVTQIGIVYDTSAAKVERVPEMIREIVQRVDGLTFDRAHFRAFGAHSLEFEFVYLVENPDMTFYLDRQQQVNLGLLRRFEAEGIRFAFPTRTVHVESGALVAPLEEEDDRPPGNERRAPVRVRRTDRPRRESAEGRS